MKQSECIVHIDFSGNYVCKMHKEIQAVHFGASQVQITLHTGCYYIAGEQKPVLFCGTSDSLQHDPAAVWAFLGPVLDDLRTTHPAVQTIHFFSDGSTTQYRQKMNFYLLSTEIFERGFSGATWNFFEAGHGKGVPDGVGGILKRTADRRVLEGFDILNSKDFVAKLKPSTSIKLYTIQGSDIMAVEKRICNKTLKTVPGTMNIHQILVVSPEQIRCRDISCTCVQDTCPDHHLRDVFLSPWGSDCKPGGCKGKKKANKRKHPESSDNHTHGAKENMRQPSPQNSRETQFENHLSDLQTAQSFQEVQHKCIAFELGDNISGANRYIEKDKFSVDYQALKLYPSDIPNAQTYPVVVRADGDCLPACGSVHAFGHDQRPAELRARIVHELACHAEYYLKEENLRKGFETSKERRGHIIKSFAMYSDEYLPGMSLDENTVKRIYEAEVIKIVKPKTFMGIWQVFALSTVLQMPIFSAYPNCGNPFVRADLHRLVMPRIDTANPPGEPLIVMWTSTRVDMNMTHWIPNHFTPGLPYSPTADCTPNQVPE
ncbi:uncharacterized protein [Littorina saxatilis]|uniref:uncharacterized protein n=1 Tax=Littorina saxatilis TaxID=31220 RepID=UPI0038B63E35